MSLGCGAYAGNITSDNITPLHLINVKRLAYELPRDGRSASAKPAAATGPPATEQLDFVCEDDVRRALRDGRRLHVAPRGIVTPAARDLAAGKDVLVDPL
jgi:hypothetical protein